MVVKYYIYKFIYLYRFHTHNVRDQKKHHRRYTLFFFLILFFIENFSHVHIMDFVFVNRRKSIHVRKQHIHTHIFEDTIHPFFLSLSLIQYPFWKIFCVGQTNTLARIPNANDDLVENKFNSRITCVHNSIVYLCF